MSFFGKSGCCLISANTRKGLIRTSNSDVFVMKFGGFTFECIRIIYYKLSNAK
jgi:hypothetical protein